jgi:hypothetical protein
VKKGTKHTEKSKAEISKTMKRKGYKNHEKYNEENLPIILDQIEAHARKEECWSGYQAADECGHLWDSIKKSCARFPDNYEIQHRLGMIDQFVKVLKFDKALKGQFVPSVSIFLGKNDHGMTDRQQVDHTTGGETIKLNLNITKNDLDSDPVE